jgi:hypothetical protein
MAHVNETNPHLWNTAELESRHKNQADFVTFPEENKLHQYILSLATKLPNGNMNMLPVRWIIGYSFRCEHKKSDGRFWTARTQWQLIIFQ